MKFKNVRILAVCALAVLANACSKSSPKDNGGSGNDSETSASKMIRYNVNLAHVNFGLTGATSFKMSVDGCASGFTSQVTEVSPNISVYKYDQGCLAKLTSLTVDGVTYTPSSSHPFQNWQQGDTAEFNDPNGSGLKLYVQVMNQLDTPIPSTAPSHGVEYAFSTITKGMNQNCANDCVQNHYSVAVNGVDAPNFEIKLFSYVDMTNKGAGVFMFKFECATDLVGSGLDAKCGGATLGSLQYTLVQDTFNGMLTIDQAKTIMSSGTSSIDTSEVVAVGADPTMPHGGFVSKVLAGPEQMHLNPDMIAVLETAKTSYKYWNVDVTPIVQQMMK